MGTYFVHQKCKQFQYVDIHFRNLLDIRVQVIRAINGHGVGKSCKVNIVQTKIEAFNPRGAKAVWFDTGKTVDNKQTDCLQNNHERVDNLLSMLLFISTPTINFSTEDTRNFKVNSFQQHS